MDVVGRIFLADGTELSAVTGIDDHSRFCVCARLVARATARPVCDALGWAMRSSRRARTSCSLITARCSPPASVPVLARCCSTGSAPTTGSVTSSRRRTRRRRRARSNGSTAPCAPSGPAPTNGASPRWSRRRHRWMPGSSTTTPSARTRRSACSPRSNGSASPPSPMSTPLDIDETVDAGPRRRRRAPRPAGVTRWVDQRGHISLARFSYRVGAAFAGEPVEVVCSGGLVDIFHAGVVVATHVQRQRPDEPTPRPTPTAARAGRRPSGSPSPAAPTQRQRQLRRHQLPRRPVLGARRRAGRHRRRLGAAVRRRQGHPRPPDPSRPHQRTRRLRHPPRPAPPRPTRVGKPGPSPKRGSAAAADRAG